MRLALFRDSPAEAWRSMDRYADNLAVALRRLVPEWEVHMPDPPAAPNIPYAQLIIRTLRYPLWARRHQRGLNHILDHSYGHLLFALDPERTVVTVHDLAPLHYPGRKGGLSGLAWKFAWKGLRRARQAIVLSTFVATELQEHLPLPLDRICVIPMGVSPVFRPQSEESNRAVRSRYAPDADCLLLNVGRGQPRKGLATLLQAVALLKQQRTGVILLQVGAKPSRSQRSLVRKLGLQGRVRFLGTLSDDDLIALYSAADVFVFPSEYEGFGMPLLESMACGTPVVCTNAASLPEVAGDAAVIVAARDPVQLAAAIERTMHDSSLRSELVERGQTRARQFTWERCARATLTAYQRLLPNLT